MTDLTRIEPRRTCHAVLDALEGRILSGAFPIGELLPLEARLAKQLGVGRRALREALKALELKGLIEIRAGVGATVKRNDLDRFLSSMTQNLRSYLHIKKADIAHVRDLRAILEGAALAKLAANPAAPAVATMAEALAAQVVASAAADADAYQRQHFLFHEALVDGLENPLVSMIYRNVLQLMYDPMHALGQNPRTMEQSIREHRAMLNAVRAGDLSRANRVLNEHLKGFARRLAGRKRARRD